MAKLITSVLATTFYCFLRGTHVPYICVVQRLRRAHPTSGDNGTPKSGDTGNSRLGAGFWHRFSEMSCRNSYPKASFTYSSYCYNSSRRICARCLRAPAPSSPALGT
eukprot:490575-Rhodomonas_salina.1